MRYMYLEKDIHVLPLSALLYNCETGWSVIDSWPADVTNEESESGTMSSLSSREIFNNNNDNHSNNNNNSATTITRYIHIKHADSSVKIFRETTV
ncbi:hypothetical protein QLX08_008287 [Tetragonisca angustula]|uniref:Uncharacterized protein n=1 Tax=Tetragonisca angustula TaxID=166442 RepID=A0AAW0ZKS6_9HYME